MATTLQKLHKVAVCVGESGRLEEAEELLRRCLRIKDAKLDPEGVWMCPTRCSPLVFAFKR